MTAKIVASETTSTSTMEKQSHDTSQAEQCHSSGGDDPGDSLHAGAGTAGDNGGATIHTSDGNNIWQLPLGSFEENTTSATAAATVAPSDNLRDSPPPSQPPQPPPSHGSYRGHPVSSHPQHHHQLPHHAHPHHPHPHHHYPYNNDPHATVGSYGAHHPYHAYMQYPHHPPLPHPYHPHHPSPNTTTHPHPPCSYHHAHPPHSQYYPTHPGATPHQQHHPEAATTMVSTTTPAIPPQPKQAPHSMIGERRGDDASATPSVPPLRWPPHEHDEPQASAQRRKEDDHSLHPHDDRPSSSTHYHPSSGGSRRSSSSKNSSRGTNRSTKSSRDIIPQSTPSPQEDNDLATPIKRGRDTSTDSVFRRPSSLVEHQSGGTETSRTPTAQVHHSILSGLMGSFGVDTPGQTPLLSGLDNPPSADSKNHHFSPLMQSYTFHPSPRRRLDQDSDNDEADDDFRPRHLQTVLSSSPSLPLRSPPPGTVDSPFMGFLRDFPLPHTSASNGDRDKKKRPKASPVGASGGSSHYHSSARSRFDDMVVGGSTTLLASPMVTSTLQRQDPTHQHQYHHRRRGETKPRRLWDKLAPLDDEEEQEKKQATPPLKTSMGSASSTRSGSSTSSSGLRIELLGRPGSQRSLEQVNNRLRTGVPPSTATSKAVPKPPASVGNATRPVPRPQPSPAATTHPPRPTPPPSSSSSQTKGRSLRRFPMAPLMHPHPPSTYGGATSANSHSAPPHPPHSGNRAHPPLPLQTPLKHSQHHPPSPQNRGQYHAHSHLQQQQGPPPPARPTHGRSSSSSHPPRTQGYYPTPGAHSTLISPMPRSGGNGHRPPLTTSLGSKSNMSLNITSSNSSSNKRPPPCKCKKSKCLKLYCDCFGANAMCTEACRCLDCHNKVGFEAIRNKAIKEIRSKNSNAFKPRLEVQAEANMGSGVIVAGGGQHNMGCKCSKTGCLKKYCECFKGGILCCDKCKCLQCHNRAGSQKLIDARRKMKDEEGAKFAMQAAHDAWRGHQRKPAGSTSTPVSAAVVPGLVQGSLPPKSHQSQHAPPPHSSDKQQHHQRPMPHRPFYMHPHSHPSSQQHSGAQPYKGNQTHSHHPPNHPTHRPHHQSVGFSPLGDTRPPPHHRSYPKAEGASTLAHPTAPAPAVKASTSPDMTKTTATTSRPVTLTHSTRSSNSNSTGTVCSTNNAEKPCLKRNVSKITPPTKISPTKTQTQSSSAIFSELSNSKSPVSATMEGKQSPPKRRKIVDDNGGVSDRAARDHVDAYFGHQLPSLPRTAALKIFSYLSGRMVHEAALVCKTWKHLGEEWELWELPK